MPKFFGPTATPVEQPADGVDPFALRRHTYKPVIAVVQGLTLAPLVRWLKLDGENGLAAELNEARADLASAALATLQGKSGNARVLREPHDDGVHRALGGAD